MAIILDISHHQDPAKMDYQTLASQIELVIIRTQYGSNLIDRHYKTHHKTFQKLGVPTAAYAWVRGVSVSDMKKEASDFYERTKSFQPTFWFVDVEEKSMANMREGVSAYVQQLRMLGAERVGIYVGHHLYKSFNLNLSEADAVWIPHYGKNDGTMNSKPKYKCDLHQYTDKGKLDGYNSYLDLNRIVGDKKLTHFTGIKSGSIVNTTKPTSSNKSEPKPIQTTLKGKRVENIYHGPVNFYDSARWTNPTGTFQPGEGWIIDHKYMVDGSPMYRVKNSKGDLYYITANEKYVAVNHRVSQPKKPTKKYHTVKYGDTVSQLAVQYGTSIANIKKWNKLKNVNKIYVGDRLRVG